MRYSTQLINCCGLNGFDYLPRTKEEFIEQMKVQMRDQPMRGSHVIVTTASYQPYQAKYLKELGFVDVSTERNTNSGNEVTLWVMSRAKFNQKIRRLIRKLPPLEQRRGIFG